MAVPPKPPVQPFYGSGMPQGYDWTAILQQWLAPYLGMYNEQMAELGRQQDAARGLAQSNFNIDSDQLKLLHEKAVTDIKNAMGARQLTDSGENQYQTNKETKLYKMAQDRSANALQSYLQNLANTYSNAKLSGLQSLQQQRLGLLSTLPQLYPGSGSTTPWWTTPSSTGPMTPPGGWGWGG